MIGAIWREVPGIVGLALPIVMGLAASTLIGVTDSVMLAPLGPVPLAAVGLTGAVAVAVLAAAGFLALGEYTRKVRVSGVLVPDSGVIRLVPPQDAVVLERRVAEGARVRAGDAIFYFTALLFWGAAIWQVRPQALALLALLPAACHLLWQVATLRADDGTDALVKFRSNRFTGMLVALAMITIGASA